MRSASTHLMVVLALILAGCGGDGGNAVAPNNNNEENPTSLQWTPTQRTPVSEHLRSVDGFGDTRIAVGDGGTILIRIGNGDWQVLDREFDELLKKVVMIDEKNAIVVGNKSILRTGDAGRTWKTVAQAASFLSDVSVSGKFAIAVGSETILLSGDSGETWTPASGTFPAELLVRVSHHTDQIATAVVSGGGLFQSVDGGNNWAEVGVGQLPNTPLDIAFFSEKLGVAAIPPARAFYTDDGGQTWSERASFGVNSIADLEVVDASTGYAILRSGHIHITENAGKSWAVETAVPPEFGDISALDASDASDWVAVGAFGFVSESANAGAAWQRLSEGRVGEFKSIAFANAAVGVAAFNPSQVVTETALRTTDGGATWDPVDPRIKRPEQAVFSSAGVGLLIGSDEVSKSTNDGASWVDVSPATNFGLLAGAIIDELTYVVCGNSGTVFRTIDGAATWDDASVNSNDPFTGISFFPGTDVGVMVASDAGFRSTDLGASWSAVNVRGLDVACVTADVAVAVHEEILRSSDRGASWSIVTVPEHPLHSVAFSGEKHGIAVGANGIVLETLDGGLTWNEIARKTSLLLRTVAFRDNESALSGGRFGAMLLGTP